MEGTAATVRVHGIGAGDAAGVLAPASAALIRPDGHIAAVGPADAPQAIRAYLQTWTHSAAG
ncbi:hypothetical protein O4J56_16350 [Nocardiopsis sp. RSe5-2]|uniref:Uncharacterized protein n=1 Tax=Nocardiopsis endophytica TaxID=3018445 RepID=A0ABT4U798_9ACTN|nr:hypothetical protein [Nocardiopsis endophytica]MDA2812217.1 hypothetical protein [Nocardiopsis endophytica]